MRIPVILVAGQELTDALANELLQTAGTVVIRHRFDGQVVCRSMIMVQRGVVTTAQAPLELAHGCVSCTIRNDLLVLLRKVSRRSHVHRVVAHLGPWLEPEPIYWAIQNVRVAVGPGFQDGPAARDVEVVGVITGVDDAVWLAQALGDEELPDGRTVAQVVVAQAEFADILVCAQPSEDLPAVLARLNPTARVIANVDAVEDALRRIPAGSRRGRSDNPHGPLLAGQPSLQAAGKVQLIEFWARRPLHPDRLYGALDTLLENVIRARGRLWLASNGEQVMWLESAGGGMRVSSAGQWLAAMGASQLAYADPERRAMADAFWDERHGDRHTAVVVLVCGANSEVILDALRGALLTDEEMHYPDRWPQLNDPFGDWYEDPCSEAIPVRSRNGQTDDEKGQS